MKYSSKEPWTRESCHPIQLCLRKFSGNITKARCLSDFISLLPLSFIANDAAVKCIYLGGRARSTPPIGSSPPVPASPPPSHWSSTPRLAVAQLIMGPSVRPARPREEGEGEHRHDNVCSVSWPRRDGGTARSPNRRSASGRPVGTTGRRRRRPLATRGGRIMGPKAHQGFIWSQS